MDIINIIVWIIVGALAGWLASLVMKTNQEQGLIADIIVGIIGAFIGGFVLNLLGIGGAVTGLNIASILTAFIGAVILLESALSYLGLGVQPPTASWGNMLTNAQRFFSSAVWLVLVPGWFIWSTVQALYLVADGLRDALDPRLK